MSIVIAFAGKAGSGKSTIAGLVRDALVMRHDLVMPVVSFADPLKDMVRVLFAYANVQECQKNEQFLFTDKTYRYILQTLGTDWARTLVDKDFWSKLVEERYTKNGKNIIIDDLRFGNECGFIKSQELGLTFYIQRDQNVIDFNADLHISENDLQPEDCEYVINNNRQLYEAVDDIVKIVVERYDGLSKNTV